MNQNKKFSPQSQGVSEQITTLKDKISSIKDIFTKISPLLPNTDDIRKMFDSNQKLFDSLDSPAFHVCFAGAYSTGKSTLINSIIGKEILPRKDIPTTACPTFIRKSANDSEYGDIFYSSISEREELKEAYLRDLSQDVKFTIDIEQLLKMEPRKLLDTVKTEVNNHKNNNKALSNDSFVCLEYLLNEWSNKIEYIDKNKPLKEVQSITEDNQGTFDPSAILISKIDIYLNNISYDSSIVLVDLPGLGSKNINHERITRKYAFDSNTKSFTFIFSPKKLAEGTTSQFMSDINNNKRLLSKSFWVINMWDEVKTEMDENTLEASFKQGLKNCHIGLMDDRFYKTSALNKIENKETIWSKNVDKFKDDFFNYLNRQIFEEFINEVNTAYYSIYNKLKSQVSSINLPSENPDDIKVSYIAEKMDELYDQWYKNVNEAIETALIITSSQIDNFEILRSVDLKVIRKKLEEIFTSEKAFQKLEMTKFREEDDHSANWNKFISEIGEKYTVTTLIRSVVKDRVNDTDIKDILNSFRKIIVGDIISDNITISIPQDIKDTILDYVNEENLHYRFSGVEDSIFIDYDMWRTWFDAELTLDKVKPKIILYKNNTFDIIENINQFKNGIVENDWVKKTENLPNALNLIDYSDFVIYFLKNIQFQFIDEAKDDINKIVRFSLKNQVKNIRKFYEDLLVKKRKDVRKKILDTLSKQSFDPAIQNIIQKINNIKTAKDFFINN